MVSRTELRDVLEFIGLVGLGVLSIAGLFGAFPLIPSVVCKVALVAGSVMFVYFAYGYFDVASDIRSLPARLLAYLLVWLYSVGLASLFGFVVYGLAVAAGGWNGGSP